MAAQVLTNARIWVAGFNFSGDLNAIALKYGADMVDKTNFLSGGVRERLAGLLSFSFQHEGYWQGGANNVDDAIWNSLFAIKNSVMSLDASGAGVEGDSAYAGQVDVAKYEPGAKVGDMFAFSVSGDSDGDPLVSGTLVANRTATSSGNSAGYQLGAVSAAQKVYAALHVLQGVSGTLPTLNAVLQSSVDNTFASPTSRITFAQATAPGAQWMSQAGAITDTWWRLNYTLGGTTPSFPVVAVVGIR